MAAPPREQSARGLDAVLSPRSVAVVGAGPDPASVGHRLMASILRHGFTGAVHPVHPSAKEVLGRPASRSVLDVPGPVDLAVVAVPAAAALKVAEECARKGVRGIVMVTAGFRETGEAGAKAEAGLGELVRAHGIRLVGPNCLGVINADPAVRLHAIFSDTPCDGGPVALMTQSGALGIALLERAHALGLGIGRFVSMGNKVDVSGNDLLLHWGADPGVELVAMHLESVGNPRNFLRIAGELSRRKPVLIVKGGRTPEGAKAAGSHTGAMVEADALVDAMVRQAGVVRVATVEELFDAALALVRQPRPGGNRLAIVTNSGGPAILMTDALPAAGLRLAPLAPGTVQSLRARLPPDCAPSNPVDMLAGASPGTLTACLGDVLRDPAVDVAVALVTPLAPDDTPWADAILAAKRAAGGKPLVAVLFGRDATSAAFKALVAGGVPAYTFPENAARALGAVERVRLAQGAPVPGGTGPRATAAFPARRGAGGWLTADEALKALDGLGARRLASALARDPDGAADAAARLGFPVALKVQAPGLVHKTEAGAVRLGLADRGQVLEAAHVAWERVRAAGHVPESFLLQQMAPPGLELIVGAVRDAKFGPVVSVGLGGTYTEALRDVAVRLAPVTPAEADEMLDSLRSRALLAGVRGEPAKDRAAVRGFIVALAGFIDANPDVAEVEVNPVRVLPEGQGLVAVDARLRLAPP